MRCWRSSPRSTTCPTSPRRRPSGRRTSWCASRSASAWTYSSRRSGALSKSWTWDSRWIRVCSCVLRDNCLEWQWRLNLYVCHRVNWPSPVRWRSCSQPCFLTTCPTPGPGWPIPPHTVWLYGVCACEGKTVWNNKGTTQTFLTAQVRVVLFQHIRQESSRQSYTHMLDTDGFNIMLVLNALHRHGYTASFWLNKNKRKPSVRKCHTWIKDREETWAKLGVCPTKGNTLISTLWLALRLEGMMTGWFQISSRQRIFRSEVLARTSSLRWCLVETSSSYIAAKLRVVFDSTHQNTMTLMTENPHRHLIWTSG